MNQDLYVATAQANLIDVPSTGPDGSHLLLFDNNKLHSREVIKTTSALKVSYFKTAGNEYLLYIGKSDAVVFWWSGQGFLEYQTIRGTANAIDASSVHATSGDLVLSFLFPDKVTFFMANKEASFSLSYAQDFAAGSIAGESLSGLSLISYGNKYQFALLSVAPRTSRPNSQLAFLWKLKFVPHVLREDKPHDPLVSCLLDVGNDLKRREDHLKVVASKADRIWMVNKPQVVTAPVIVEGRIRIEGPGFTRVTNMVVTTNSTNIPQITNTQIDTRLRNMTAVVGRVKQELSNVVLNIPSQPLRPITGKITFAEPITASRAIIGNISNDVSLNGVQFSQLAGNTLKVLGEQVITGRWTFLNNVSSNRLILTGSLNGIKVKDILLKNTQLPQVVTGSITFTNITTKAAVTLPPQGKVNGIAIDDFVTSKAGPAQVISGSKIFRNAEAKLNVDVSGLTNGKDLSAISHRAVRLIADESNPQIITGDLVFEGPLSIENLQVNGLINDKVNVTKMALEGVTKQGHNQVISGHKTFQGKVTVTGDVSVDGLVNSLNFYKDIVTTNTPQNITGSLTFQAPVKFAHDVATLTVNGIDLSREAVLRNSSQVQVITARKGFERGLKVSGHVTMDDGSTIDTVDPSEMAKAIVSRNKVSLDGPVHFEQVRVKGNVILQKPLNNRHRIRDLPNTLWLKSKDQVINVPVTFVGPIKGNSLVAGLVNGMKFPEDFVLKNSLKDQVITGEKIFLDEVKLPNGGFTTSPDVKMNGVNLQQFNREVVRNLRLDDGRVEAIPGVKIFNQLHVKGNVYARRVNGLDLARDVLLKNGAQTVEGRVVFRSPETRLRGSLEVRGNVNVRETVNGIRLRDWFKDVVLLGSEDLLKRPIRNKNFEGGFSVGTLTAHGTVGGVDIQKMRSEVVTLDSPQTITGFLNFTGPVRFEDSLGVHSLNGLNITEHRNRVIMKTARTVVLGRKDIKGKLTVNGNLHVGGLVNGINITRLARSALSKTSDNEVLAHITFGSNVFMTDLLVDRNRTIDGLKLNDLVFLNQDANLTGTVTLEGDAYIEGNLFVSDGVVNGCSLPRLLDEAIPLDATKFTKRISGRNTFGNIDVLGDVNINSSLNGMDISRLALQVVNLRGNQTLRAPLVFEDKITVDNLILSSTINNIDLNALLMDAVFKSRSQTIGGRKIFTKDVISQGPLLTTADVQVKGLVNGVNVTYLNQTLVTKHGNQQISGVKKFTHPGEILFKNDVTVGGRIGSTANRVRIPQDLVQLNIPEDDLRGHFTITSPAWVRRDLSFDRANGEHFRNFVGSRVSGGENQTIFSNVTFANDIKIHQLIVRKTINGIPVEDIVTRGGNHVLKGRYKFSKGIAVTGDVVLGPRSLVNNKNFKRFADNAIDIKKGGLIPGTTFFRGPVSIGKKPFFVRAHMNGVNLNQLETDYKNYSSRINTAVNDFRHQVNENEIILNRQLRQVKGQPTTLNYFDLWYEFGGDDFGRSITTERFLTLPVLRHNATRYGRALFHPTAESLLYWRITKSNTENPPCRDYSTVHLRVEVNGNLEEVATIAPRSRAFPIYPNPLHDGSTNAFYLWTNTSGCHRSAHETSSLVTLYATPRPNKVAGPRFAAYSPPNSPYLKDAKFFTDAEELFVVLAYSYHKARETSKTNSLVYRFDSAQQLWVIQQQIETFGAVSLDVVVYQPYPSAPTETMLAIANRLTVRGTPAPSIVMRWKPAAKRFDQLNVIHTWSPSSVLFLPTLDTTLNPALLLVFANEKAKLFGGQCDSEEDAIFDNYGESYSSFFTQPINVYIYGDNNFRHIQSINIPGVSTMDKFSLPPAENFLVVGSKLLGRTFILKLRGFNIFQEIQSFSTPGVENVKAFWSQSGELFIAIASSKAGHTKILKASLSGPSPKLSHGVVGSANVEKRSDRFQSNTTRSLLN